MTVSPGLGILDLLYSLGFRDLLEIQAVPSQETHLFTWADLDFVTTNTKYWSVFPMASQKPEGCLSSICTNLRFREQDRECEVGEAEWGVGSWPRPESLKIHPVSYSLGS